MMAEEWFDNMSQPSASKNRTYPMIKHQRSWLINHVCLDIRSSLFWMHRF